MKNNLATIFSVTLFLFGFNSNANQFKLPEKDLVDTLKGLILVVESSGNKKTDSTLKEVFETRYHFHDSIIFKFDSLGKALAESIKGKYGYFSFGERYKTYMTEKIFPVPVPINSKSKLNLFDMVIMQNGGSQSETLYEVAMPLEPMNRQDFLFVIDQFQNVLSGVYEGQYFYSIFPFPYKTSLLKKKTLLIDEETLGFKAALVPRVFPYKYKITNHSNILNIIEKQDTNYLYLNRFMYGTLFVFALVDAENGKIIGVTRGKSAVVAVAPAASYGVASGAGKYKSWRKFYLSKAQLKSFVNR